MSKKRFISGWEFGKALVAAGIIPENSGDTIIEVKVDGAVIIHTCLIGQENLLGVIPSDVTKFHIEDKS